MPAKQLNPKQARFVQEYLLDRNGRRAAIRAGYSERSANQTASDLLRLPKYQHVRAAVDAAIADEARANSALRARICEELCAVGFSRVPELLDASQLAELDEHQQAAVSQISYFTDSDGGRTLARIRTWSKTQALALLLKNFAMLERAQGADDITRAIAEVESGLDLYETQLDALVEAVEAVEQSEVEPSSPL